MSFAGPSPADRGRRPTQQSSARVFKSRDGDSAYLEDSRRVQAAVKDIEQLTAEIRRETNSLGTSQLGPAKRKVLDASKAAFERLGEAKRLLDGFGASSSGLSLPEQNLRKTMQQKQSMALSSVSESLKVAIAGFEAAEAERSKRDAQSSSGSKAARTASGVEMHTMEGGATDVEQGRRQMQEIDLTEAEAETHAAIVDEFVEELHTLQSGIQGLQRAMVDLAEHAKAQGETLDIIEATTTRAAENTAGAREQLVITSNSQRTGSKLLYTLLAVAVFLAVTIIIVVVMKHR